MSEANGLPEGWVETSIGEVVEPKVSQEEPRGNQTFVYVDIGAVNNDTKRIEGAKEMSPKEAPSRARQRLKAGDVLVSMTRPNLNAVAHVPEQLDGAISSTGFDVLRSSIASSGWLFCVVRNGDFVRAMSELVQGALYPAVRPRDIRGFRFPLPPLPEQHRIVEKIEALFGCLDEAVSALTRARANLKRYRASVLKSAVEGRLTEEWRKANPQAESGTALLERILRERRENWEREQLASFRAKGKDPPKGWRERYEEPEPPETGELQELPEAWVWASVDCATIVHDDLREPVNAEERSRRMGEFPYYGATGQVGWIDGFLMDGEYVLLGEDGAPFFDPFRHKAYRVEGKAWVNNHAHVLRGMTRCLENRFLVHVLNALDYRPFVNGTTRLKLTQAAMRRIPIPLPPLAEQRAIVALVEERLSQIDDAEKVIGEQLARAGRLRQSILKRAFEGRLVPQDPNDEPASVLLERIKASVEAEPKAKGKRKTPKAKARTR
jgi:type I restriction enzyme S subunit